MATIVTPNNIHIDDSSLFPRDLFNDKLFVIRRDHAADCLVLQNRTDRSLRREWAVHKACYWLHIARERTRDVDLEWPQPWYLRVAYTVIGFIVYPFV